jgi:hypothetical protein
MLIMFQPEHIVETATRPAFLFSRRILSDIVEQPRFFRSWPLGLPFNTGASRASQESD